MTTIEQVREAALQLPVVDRESLVQDLLESLEPESPDQAHDDDWVQELLYRSDDLHSGKVLARDWRESMTDIRRQFESQSEP